MEHSDTLNTPEGKRGQAIQEFANTVAHRYFSDIFMNPDHHFTYEERRCFDTALRDFRANLHRIANEIVRSGSEPCLSQDDNS